MNEPLIKKLISTIIDETIPDAVLNVKQDVASQLYAMFINEGNINYFDNVIESIRQMAERFAVIPLDVINMLGYLNEVLDIPAVQPSEQEIKLLSTVLAKLQTKNMAIVKIDDPELVNGLPTFDSINNGAFAVDTDLGTFTFTLIKFNQNDTILFMYSMDKVIVAEFNIEDETVVARVLKDYSVQDLVKAVNETPETHKLKLMEEREIETLSELNDAEVVRYLDLNKDTLLSNPNMNNQGILNLIINKYALDRNLDLSNKRIEIPNARAVLAVISDYMTRLEPTEAEATVVPADAPAPMVEYDVTPQAGIEPPPAPEPEVAPAPVETSAVVDVTSGVDHIVNNLLANPAEILNILQRYPDSYQDALINNVVNSLPTLLRQTEPLSDDVIAQVQEQVTLKLPMLYAVAENHRKEERQKYEDSRNKFTQEEVLAVINNNQSHVEFADSLNVNLPNLASKIADYFNDNNVDLSLNDTRENTILNMVNVLALYEYNSEAIASEEFRRGNVPTSEDIIFGTKFFKTLIKKNYEGVTIDDDDLAFGLAKDLESVGSLLDLSSDTLKKILSILKEKQRARVNSMYLIRGKDIPSQELDSDNDVIKIENNYATLAVITSGRAEILYIYQDAANYHVTRSSVIEAAANRMTLIDFLDA